MSIPARLSGAFFVSGEIPTHRQWYEALGWRSARRDHLFVPFPLGAASVALFDRDVAAGHVGAILAGGHPFAGFMLSVVVPEAGDVAAALDAARAAGASVTSESGPEPFGRSGWFVDPAGTTWEISWIDGVDAHAPFHTVAPDDDAVAPSLVQVTLTTPEPDAQRAFYRALGWPFEAGAFRLEGADLAIEAGASGGVTLTLAAGDAAAAEEAFDCLVDQAVVAGDGYVVDPAGARWSVVATS